MSKLSTFSKTERKALRWLVNGGIRDFELQVRHDPRMKDHIADGEMTLEDYREMHASLVKKLRDHDTFDYRLFDRDETMFIAHLAQEGTDIGDLSPDSVSGKAAREWQDSIVAKAQAMDTERRGTDSRPVPHVPHEPVAPKPERTYSRATLEEASKRLNVGDWDAHRKLAQVAVESGYAAEVAQDFNNDASDPQPLTHSIRILEAAAVQPRDVDSAGLSTEFDAMGGTTEVEQFTPDRPYGDYGPKTPFDIAPSDPEGPGNPTPSDAHLSALSAQPPHPQAPSAGLSLS